MMEPLFTVDPPAPTDLGERRRGTKKSHGVHYTPPDLAAFVARRVTAQLAERENVVLDPACGDGELLLALAIEMAAAGLPLPQLVGVDRDPCALAVARERLIDAPAGSVTLRCGDFLDASGPADVLLAEYDAVISNPPYVRTQVLGAARAQGLARQFDLSGRVDLYHAFVAAMTTRLAPNAILGLLCSNRFLTTKGGRSLRSLLLSHYELAELWDLGDTKLFDAAVLPVVLIGRRATCPAGKAAQFVRVYEQEDASPPGHDGPLLAALEAGIAGSIEVRGRRLTVERGHLVDATVDRPWRLTSTTGARWLAEVMAHSAGRLGDLGPIRVGIKTTADSVFIRASWDDLPEECRPESELVRPLLTHRVAERWRAIACAEDARSVLYTHESRGGRRQAVDLSRFPRASAYLEAHRGRLEGRDYIRRAGRQWYEIWVPQQPDAWAATKLVWPDISDRPRFFADTTGSIVNGDCYWLSCQDRTAEEIALALAVANSSFALRYYDMCCGNRLYAGRRRFITQYLEGLPLPGASAAQLREIAVMVEQLRRGDGPDGADRLVLEHTLDAAVSELFGLAEEVDRES